jgi:hypothetical protein
MDVAYLKIGRQEKRPMGTSINACAHRAIATTSTAFYFSCGSTYARAARRYAGRGREWKSKQPPEASGCGPSPAAESGHRSLQPAQRHAIYFVTSPLGHHCEGGHHRSGAPGNSRNKYRGLRGHGQVDAFPDHADRRVQGFQPPSARLVKHKTVQRRAFTACAHRIWARRLRSLAHDFAPSVISWGVSRLPYPG